MNQITMMRASEYVTELLREEIVTGRIAAGTELQQEELSRRLNVSRMPVREALQMLESSGLVERLPNRHMRVVGLKDGQMVQLLMLLESMEEAVLRMLGETPGFEWKANPPKDLKAAQVFHLRLAEAAGNAHVARPIVRLVNEYLRYAAEDPRVPLEPRLEALARADIALAQKAPEAATRALKAYYAIFDTWLKENRI